jgi:putative hydrolase of the HAD superfamily
VPAFLFDIGNVLVSFDFSIATKRLADRSPLPLEQIMNAIAPMKDPLESGRLSDEDFVAQSMAAIQFQGSAEDFSQIWCEIFALNEPMARLLAALPSDIPAYLLSNTSGLHLRYLLGAFPILGRFQGGVYSHEARCMKPDDSIFHIATEQLALDPAQTFYIDDLTANIATGHRLGFVSHLYDLGNHEALELAVSQWLVSVQY